MKVVFWDWNSHEFERGLVKKVTDKNIVVMTPLGRKLRPSVIPWADNLELIDDIEKLGREIRAKQAEIQHLLRRLIILNPEQVRERLEEKV